MAQPRMRLSEKVARARLSEYRARVPVLYALLIFNMAFLSLSDAAAGRRAVCLGATAFFAIVAIIRLGRWRRLPVDSLTHADIRSELRRASVMVCVLGLGGLALALWLYPGVTGPSEPVNAFVGLTIASVVYLLSPAPATAYTAICLIMGPYCLAMLIYGDDDQRLLACNFAALAGVLFFAVRIYVREFTRAAIDAHRARRRADVAHDLYRRNSELARTDALTGLPNRRSFFDRLERLAAGGGETHFALGVLDLDTFKAVNDMFGHAAGDELLRGVADRLLAHGDRGVWAARLGGDEFGVIFFGDSSDEELALRASRLLDDVRAFSLADRADVRAEASLGLAAWPRHGDSATALFEHADCALYHAKETRRGAAVVFTAEIDAGLRRRRMIERRLRQAEFFDRIDVAFHPIVDVRSGRIVCLEALARWTDEELGVVRPDEFIPVCEQNNLMAPLTLAVMRRAFAQARGWSTPVRVAINLSAQDLGSDRAVLDIIAAIRSAGLGPDRVTLEITETTLIANFDRAARALTTLKALGARIALDDFGNGYSALRYVRALPLDEIKIDKSLTEDVVGDARARKLLQSILALCVNLDIDVVVEGVETERQVEALRGIGCLRMQGYYFTKPLAAPDAAALIARESAPAIAG